MCMTGHISNTLYDNFITRDMIGAPMLVMFVIV